MKPGMIAGGKEAKGYLSIRIDGKRYKSHRLAWLYMTGRWPKDQIDHLNGVRDDNHWFNLREANASQNRRNSAGNSSSSSIYKGVSWHGGIGKWVARYGANGKIHNLGSFDREEDARRAYIDAAKPIFGDFFRA